MPKGVQPPENVAKLHYAATFPPDMSLLLLERKSVTLQHMFIDCLEVEDNLRMSKIFLDQESGDKMEKKLDLVVIAYFTTLGESHLYGLPLSLCRLFRPLGPFFVL